MAQADDKDTRKAPEAKDAEVRLQGAGGLSTDAHRHVTVDIDSSLPSAQSWIEEAVARLKTAPDCPTKVTDAARRLEKAEAFRRRQVDAAWGEGHIKNTLTALELWERKRPKKG